LGWVRRRYTWKSIRKEVSRGLITCELTGVVEFSPVSKFRFLVKRSLMKKITEQDSPYRDLEKMDTGEILTNINKEDHKVALAVKKVLPLVAEFIDAAVERMELGGRVFYIGAGTSGRLGILDASECPPTFGVSPDLFIGLIAGGDRAIRKAVEKAEDDYDGAWRDLQNYDIEKIDTVVGIAASGTTPYVVGGLDKARSEGLLTACITANPGAPVSSKAEYAIEVETGPEFLTGSTRMKAGTAQKMVLNMISTGIMIRLGRVLDNKMVDMQLNNAKLRERAVDMVVALSGLSEEKAEELLREKGSVRAVLKSLDMG